ncbi:hypothetical protein C2G38_2193776 [Gigaspora rosea]|uniref:Uncharacterized protein n=1 Tax=Gigaspora rosea TaxID=44941 RepID=A0A397V1M5_9GLOM|nr:hypothetical protein C2G38_2193776 [Gigaspora rosea]
MQTLQQNNTSIAWCQTYDPKNDMKGQAEIKMLMIILKKFNFKATEYGVVVEWIPFNRLNNVKKTSESKRHHHNGLGRSCYRANTSTAWCQTCDTQKKKTVQGCTSGNKQIDECIKEFQPKATEYDNVIEWDPFNRFDSIQRINKYEFGSIFLSQNG